MIYAKSIKGVIHFCVYIYLFSSVFEQTYNPRELTTHQNRFLALVIGQDLQVCICSYPLTCERGKRQWIQCCHSNNGGTYRQPQTLLGNWVWSVSNTWGVGRESLGNPVETPLLSPLCLCMKIGVPLLLNQYIWDVKTTNVLSLTFLCSRFLIPTIKDKLPRFLCWCAKTRNIVLFCTVGYVHM